MQVPEAGVHAAAHLLLRHEVLGLRGLGIRQDILERRAIVRDRLLQLGQGLDGDQERLPLPAGVQPRAALRSWGLGARPWRSHSLVAAACSLLWRSIT